MVKSLFVGFVRLYQVLISPLFVPACRFYPSCSNYAIQAVKGKGIVKGGWLVVKRLVRCHPFADGGYEPVLKNRSSQ